MVSGPRLPQQGGNSVIGFIQTPFRHIAVTAAAAASIVTGTVSQTFHSQHPKIPAQKTKQVRKDATKTLPIVRRSAPVYSVPSPSRHGDDFNMRPYELKPTPPKRVKLMRIKRRESGSDKIMEQWIDQQARLEAAKARSKRRSKKVHRQSSGASLQAPPKRTAYDVLLQDTHAVRGPRTSQQISVRNRAINDIHQHALRDLKNPSKRKNRWEATPMNRVKQDEALEFLERRDMFGNLLPPPESNEDSILAAAATNPKKESRKSAVHPEHYVEPRDRHTRRKDVELSSILKAYVHMNPGKQTSIRRHNSGTDMDCNDDRVISSRSDNRTKAAGDRRNRRKTHSEYSTTTSTEDHEINSDYTEDYGQGSKIHHSIRRENGGSLSVLGQDTYFQPDFYTQAPPLNLQFDENSAEMPLSPSAQLELIQCLAEKEPALLKLAEKLSLVKSKSQKSSPQRTTRRPAARSKESPKSEETSLQNQSGPSNSIEQAKAPELDDHPDITVETTILQENQNVFERVATANDLGLVPLNNEQETSSDRGGTERNYECLQSKEKATRESICAFTIEEQPKQHAAKAATDAIVAEKPQLTNTPKLVTPKWIPPLEEEINMSSSEKSSALKHLWDTVSMTWADLFYEDPGPDSEGRPFFSFVPIIGYPLNGEDKWAKYTELQKADDLFSN
ncbi:unnamed protein product [Notodromas monacha]|uniref:Uncharacterized protein n=1 Tax=Notodromas monacha TaxID=399045 RepID=A0A7R9BMP7_9CRUS|nr:unnamed protein product [Notodromas monacha]CAG0917458.1 unnamed protein product [Notodromas monacha]